MDLIKCISGICSGNDTIRSGTL